MQNPITLIQLGIRFLTHDVWHITADNVSGYVRYLINIIKALFLSTRFFMNDRMMEKASALTYYTLLAIVPLVALILGIAKGFNVQDMLEQTLTEGGSLTNNQTIHYIMTFAQSYLEHAKTGVIMGIGIVMLLWVIYNLIGNIEAVFNQIWQQKKGRSTIRKITDYLSIILILPILVFLVCGLQVVSHAVLSSEHFSGFVTESIRWGFKWVPFIVIIMALSLIYMVIPNTKVKFSNALIAGAVAGTGFVFFQDLYLSGQIWVSKYNAIYGSFAALPLLLLWIQMSWVICLYGAELSFAAQNMRDYDYEDDTNNISRRYYDFLCIVVSGLIYNNHPNKWFTTEEIASTLHLPSKLTGNIVARLRDVEIINESINRKKKEEENVWTPGQRDGELTIGQLLERIEQYGSSDFHCDYTSLFANEWNLLKEMNQSKEAIGSQLVRDIHIDEEKIKEICSISKSVTKIFRR